MIAFVLALLVAVLFGAGVYLVLQRNAVRVILGLGLLSHAVNLLLFSTSTLKRGLPPIVLDKAAFRGEIGLFVDPLPQALILTAIVISFGITAFMIALANRRNHLLAEATQQPERADDPFALTAPRLRRVENDDYEWLEDVRNQGEAQQ